MEIKQFIRTRWQAFRAWQENPRTYHLDKTEHVCNNCGHTFKGNYCPVCSQSARHGRIGWLTLWEGIGQLWGIESRSGIYTIWQLLWRPGYLVRDYISGKRQVSYPPVKLLFILAAIIAVVQFFFPVHVKEPVATGFRYLDFTLTWLQNHENIEALLAGCVFILPTWWLFRNAPRYPHHTIPEGFFLQVYIAILSFLFSSVFAELTPLAVTLSYAYMYMIYKQLFGYGYWGTLWRLVVSAVMSFVVIFVLIVIGLTISEFRQVKPDVYAFKCDKYVNMLPDYEVNDEGASMIWRTTFGQTHNAQPTQSIWRNIVINRKNRHPHRREQGFPSHIYQKSGTEKGLVPSNVPSTIWKSQRLLAFFCIFTAI